MSDRGRQVLAVLADGEIHSGQHLADATGVTRSAVWKQIRRLAGLGLEVEGTSGRGYRLAAPLELLDAEGIHRHLDPGARQVPVDIEALFEIDSTSHYLLDALAADSIHGRAVLAEYQSAGRGRRGNRWLAAPASGLCLSLGWHYESTPASLTCLSLAAGVAVAGALRGEGCRGVQLKWPNDVLVDGAKLAGILIESHAQGAGPCDVVIGVGVNVRMPEQLERTLDRRVTDLERVLAPVRPSRNRLAARLINALVAMLKQYGSDGFISFLEAWRDLDYAAGREAVLQLPGQQTTGRVVGIDENGLLVMDIEGELRKFSSGELSLRIVE